MNTERSFDFVIVGSSAGGAVVANRLSARPDVRVLTLEAELQSRRAVRGWPGRAPVSTSVECGVHRAPDTGYHYHHDFDDGNLSGAGHYAVSRPDGRRRSTWNGHLEPVADRSNLTIPTRATALRVLLNSDRATTWSIRRTITPDAGDGVAARCESRDIAAAAVRFNTATSEVLGRDRATTPSLR